jgi:hypothetical protein
MELHIHTVPVAEVHPDTIARAQCLDQQVAQLLTPAAKAELDRASAQAFVDAVMHGNLSA